jgi:DNA-binding NtrC family response regulator
MVARQLSLQTPVARRQPRGTSSKDTEAVQTPDNSILLSATARPLATDGAVLGRKLRIVIVDNDTKFCHLMEFIGLQQNLIVTTYHAVDDVELDVMASADVVVVDFDLGTSDGLALSKALRERHIEAPLLLISASQEALKMEHWADHVCGFTSKELGPFAVLESILGLAHSAHAKGQARRLS